MSELEKSNVTESCTSCGLWSYHSGRIAKVLYGGSLEDCIKWEAWMKAPATRRAPAWALDPSGAVSDSCIDAHKEWVWQELVLLREVA